MSKSDSCSQGYSQGYSQGVRDALRAALRAAQRALPAGVDPDARGAVLRAIAGLLAPVADILGAVPAPGAPQAPQSEDPGVQGVTPQATPPRAAWGIPALHTGILGEGMDETITLDRIEAAGVANLTQSPPPGAPYHLRPGEWECCGKIRGMGCRVCPTCGKGR